MILAKILASPVLRWVVAAVMVLLAAGGVVLYLEHRGAARERAALQERINDAADDRRAIDNRVRDAADDELDRWLRPPGQR